MPDAASRIYGPTALSTSAATKYTVPASTTTILRQIHVANETATERTFTLSIGADGAGTRLFSEQPVPAHDSFDWTGFIPLATTETIQALASANTALTLVMAGVVVT